MMRVSLCRVFAGLLALAAVCLSGQLGDAAIHGSAVITPPNGFVSVSTCTAPCPVFADLSGTTSTSTAYPFHELYYSTNFGDSGAGNWSYGSSNSVLSCGVGGQTTYCGFMPTWSRNVGIGPEVGHVYASAGTYNVVTTITAAHATAASSPQTVTVNDPATIYGGVWCANPSGACGGTGANCRFGGDASSPASSIGCTACVGAAFTNCPGGAGNDDPKSAGTTFANVRTAYLDSAHSNRVLIHATETSNLGQQSIASGTYNTSTHLVTLTLNATTLAQVGDTIVTSSLTGTGAFAGLDGIFAVASASGTTLTYTCPVGNQSCPGASAATITGGTLTIGTLQVNCNSCQIGSFDSGAQPIIQSQNVPTATTTSLTITIGPNTTNTTFHDVQVDAGGDGNQCFDFAQNSKRILLYNVTCTGATGFAGGTTPADDSARLDEVYINSTSWHGSGATTGNGALCGKEVVFFRGVTHLSMLGNDLEMADSMSQSMTRPQSWKFLEVGHSIYGRPCPQRAGIDLRGDTSPQVSGPVVVAQYANIHHNVAWGNGEANGGGNPLIVNEPQSSPQDYYIQDIVVESNACWMGITASNGCINTAEASNVTWRNNIVNGGLRSAGNTVMGYALVWDMDTPYHPQPQNIWAYFNVRNCNTNSITSSGSGMFKFEEQYVPGTSTFKNNLDYCQNATNAPVVIDSGSSSSPTTAGNSDQVGGSATTNPGWPNGSMGFSVYTDYATSGFTTYKNAGVNNVPVFFDFAGVAVPRTSPMIGALQFLLKRDLDPASNDNTPAFVNAAA